MNFEDTLTGVLFLFSQLTPDANLPSAFCEVGVEVDCRMLE